MIINEAVGTAIFCPVCKKFLVEAGEGTNIGITCEKCHNKYVIVIEDGMLHFSQVVTDMGKNRYPYVYVSTPKGKQKMLPKSKSQIAI